VIFAALAGIALGTICAALLAPLLWLFAAARERLTGWIVGAGVLVVVFLDSRFALTTLMDWSRHGGKYASAFYVAHFLLFVLALCIPRARKEVLTSLNTFLSAKMSRRMALATVVGAVALAVLEFAAGKNAQTAHAAQPAQRPKSNILLITFDALDAEDMSLYGYPLPTTPNIDAFAGKATVFTNFYSASTFTTPGIATMATGMYPSETHVHQLQGRLSRADAEKSLPQLMRNRGYATGGFLSNPFAYYFAKNFDGAYDSLPEPAFQHGGLQHVWDATVALHQNSGIGTRVDEYTNLEWFWNFIGHPDLVMRFRAAESFGQAREMLTQLPDGYFLWVHVMTPHQPYLPDAADQGRFLPADEGRRYADESELLFKPHYPPSQQSQVDRRRLLYDEFVLTADRAFGGFMTDLEKDGKLQNTTVIVSADHGESFEGGVFQHESLYQTRPVIHVPLIIRTPGQQDGRKVAFTADQTSLAPTILELAGQPKPEWMRGESLTGWLNRNGQGDGEGMAFCQYLERNSAFRPLHHGTVGVIDGTYQYVFDLDSQKGTLRPLKEAHIWNLDHSAENPDKAAALRAAIFSRFPELPQKP
jgi:arylsulfatase A-like enzyme